MKILIFGADGQLGGDLVKSFIPSHEVVVSTKINVDITKERDVLNIVKGHVPALVINAAAFTNVEDNERLPEESFQINALGAYYCAKAASSVGSPIIYISTDYVFDGLQEVFVADDTPHPLNIYGASKYAGELLTNIANQQAYIIRTSALFGTHASGKGYNFVDKIIELGKAHDEIRVVSDQRTAVTYALDLAGKIRELVERKAPYGTYHLTNSGSCTWYEFAVEILRQSGLKTRTVPITAQEYGSVVHRPTSSILKPSESLPPWQDALKRYLKGIGYEN